ncbi:unnamed protein product, partial [Laminaria digitata]
MSMVEDGDLNIDDLLRELEDAEAKDAQSPLVPESPGLPFRIVSVGLEGESVLVPDTIRKDRGDGEASSKDSTRAWRDVMTTSTLPFGASSLPTLSPDCRQELEDRYLSVSAHIATETQEKGVDKWFDDTTWSRSIGSELLTVAMSQARSTMAVKPAKDLKTFLGNSLRQYGPFPFAPLPGDLDSGWEVKEVPIDGDSAGGYSVGSLDKPTARLSQYARGKTGSMNPFTPGGEDLANATGEGGPSDRVRSGGFSATPEAQNVFLSDTAVTESVAALDPDSHIPLLSVPPNVPFAEGLTADNVKEGPPLWAGQARHQRIDDARVRAAAESADGADGAGGADGTGVGE